MLLDGEIKLHGEVKTTWKKVREAILSFMPLEDIVEMKAFGSAVRAIPTKTRKGESRFFGMFREPDETYKVYPKDIDVLLILKGKPEKAHIAPQVHTEFLEYHESCGYGFTCPSSGFRSGILHVTMMSKAYWDQALENKDPDALRINAEAVNL